MSRLSRLTVAIDINATPAQMWSVLEPIEDHVSWMHDAVAIRFQSEQQRGVGTTFLCDTKIGPLELVDHMEITEWIPDSVMGVRHTGVVTGTGRFTLTPIDLGRRTRFGWDESLVFPWWLGGPIGAFVCGHLVLRTIWKRNLRALKNLVETRPDALVSPQVLCERSDDPAPLVAHTDASGVDDGINNVNGGAHRRRADVSNTRPTRAGTRQ